MEEAVEVKVGVVAVVVKWNGLEGYVDLGVLAA